MIDSIYATSSFGVNIGTGLLLESIIKPTTDRIDSERVIPNKVKLSDYELYYISLPSLITNIISSYNSEFTTKLLANDKQCISDVFEKIVSEMFIVSNLLEAIDIKYYNTHHTPYDRKGLLKKPKEDTKSFKLISITDLLVKKVLESKEVSVDDVDLYLPSKKKSLISTSNTLDLLNSNKMELDLLEFHTGVLKKRNKFYSKLNTTEDIPFEEVLLFAIGDKKGLINPVLNIKERKELISVIKSKNLKSYNRYNKGFIMDIVTNPEIVNKLKTIPSLF